MDDNNSTLKVALLGEAGVGKTCIISRYVRNTFTGKTVATNGASFATKTIKLNNDKEIKFEIWDTAGQEKYRSLTKFFYKDASIAILVYEITRRSSFEEIKNYWYKQLKEFCEKKIIIGIAANKSDLFEKEEVEEIRAKEFADSIGAIYRATSAKLGSGINELFLALANKYMDPSFQDDILINKEGKDIEEESKNESFQVKKKKMEQRRKISRKEALCC